MQKLCWLTLFLMGCLLVNLSHGLGVPAGAGTQDVKLDDYHDDANDGDNYGGSEETEEENDNDNDNDEAGVDVEAVITTKPMTIEADIGGEFQLTCQGEPGNSAVIWEKEGQPLFLDGNSLTQDKRLSVEETSTKLIVKNVTGSDTGKYKCRYSTEKPVEVIHTVKVRVIPRVDVGPSVRVLKHGEPAVLECNVTGYPTPNAYWERKNKRMPGGETRIEGNVITFPTVTRHHAGIYECVAENPIGSARTALDLQIRYPPEIEVEKESVSTGQGLNADLVCLVHAEPKATVVWYKNGLQVQTVMGPEGHDLMEKVSHRYILHLKDVRENDFGKYQCIANNTLGRDNKSILLSGAPSQPVLESEKSRLGKDGVSYNLVWVLESTIRVDQFKLKYRKTDEEWMEVDVLGSQIQPHVYLVNHSLEGLSPSSDYQAVLLAHNDYGWSPESRIHSFHIHGKEYQSQEAETGSGAKAVESTAGGASATVPAALFSSKSLIALFLTIFTAQLLQL